MTEFQTDSHQHVAPLGEISAILAAGFLRVLERKSSQNLPFGAKTLLDCVRDSGGDVSAMSEDITP
jgi:hypothetical protein